MHSSDDTLVRMANQIAKFFHVQGEARAVPGIADHIKKFWEPRMKSAIFAYVEAGGDGLDPLAMKALETLKASYQPSAPVAPAREPAAKVAQAVQQAKAKGGRKATAH